MAIFLFNLSAITPQFKTQADFSFVVILINIPLQYFIGFLILRTYDKTIQSSLFCVLTGVLLCVLLVSFIHLYGTIAEYRDLLSSSPSKGKAVELIDQWEALLERNKVPSFGSIRMAAYGRIGDLKLSLGNVHGARQWYKKALREDPYNVTASLGLARLLVRKRKTAKAQEAFYTYSRALGMRPQNPWVNFRLGRIYFARGDYERAAAALQKTLAKALRNLYALSYLIDIYEKEDKMDLAQQYRDVISKEVVTRRIQQSDWRGRAGGNLYWNAGCYARIKLYKGRVRLQIQARGTPAQGVWPHMVVKLDEEVIGETNVMNREWSLYSFPADVETGEYTLGVYFINDLYLEKEVGGKKIREDRNLFVGAVKMTCMK